MTKPKHTGLAGFGIQNRNPLASASPPIANASAESTAAGVEREKSGPPGLSRQRAKGETVALTIRVNREQWRRLHDLAVVEGLSLNQLALQGLTEILLKRGLKPL